MRSPGFEPGIASLEGLCPKPTRRRPLPGHNSFRNKKSYRCNTHNVNQRRINPNAVRHTKHKAVNVRSSRDIVFPNPQFYAAPYLYGDGRINSGIYLMTAKGSILAVQANSSRMAASERIADLFQTKFREARNERQL